HKHVPRKFRHPGAVHAGYSMDGAIPLDDLGPQEHSASSSALPHDALTKPGVYQGTRYPPSDAALVQYLHSLAHMHDDGATKGPGSVHREVHGDVALVRDQGAASARSSVYNLADGSLTPNTGYAFAHQEQSRRRRVLRRR
ncbi:hypothetical protein LPJ73_008488, partial [Coemansia sp. RSA 2703]